MIHSRTKPYRRPVTADEIAVWIIAVGIGAFDVFVAIAEIVYSGRA